MATKIFVNLPVSDLNRSVEFFTQLGFTFNPQFTDENATCMIVGKDIFVMLLVENFFKTFTHKEISDATRSTEVIVSLSTDNRESVDEMVRKAIVAAQPPPANRRITDSCTNMASRIWMGISGRFFSWNQAGYRRPNATAKKGFPTYSRPGTPTPGRVAGWKIHRRGRILRFLRASSI